jgi:hypothetical protein
MRDAFATLEIGFFKKVGALSFPVSRGSIRPTLRLQFSTLGLLFTSDQFPLINRKLDATFL